MENVSRLAELSYEKGDKVEAASFVDSALTLICSHTTKDVNYNPQYILRAYLIGAKVKSGGASFFMLQKALTYAIRCGYPRFRALIQLELAELQVRKPYELFKILRSVRYATLEIKERTETNKKLISGKKLQFFCVYCGKFEEIWRSNIFKILWNFLRKFVSVMNKIWQIHPEILGNFYMKC